MLEREFIQYLKSQIQIPFADTRVTLGIGDDAACLDFADREVVSTMDTLVEGVHFDTTTISLEDVGRKALAVNLSDLAAMGCYEPHSFLMSMAAPKSMQLESAKSLVLGMQRLADWFDIPLVGGDFVTTPGPLTITVQASGLVAENQLWTMSGAKAGDVILVSGEFGGSILEKHYSFSPRLDIAELVARRGIQLNAATDVTDGLIWDLHQVCAASNVGARLDKPSIPIHESLLELETDQESRLVRAMHDGEDFELILVADPSNAKRLVEAGDELGRLTPIGTIVADSGLFDESGIEIKPKGYSH